MPSFTPPSKFLRTLAFLSLLLLPALASAAVPARPAAMRNLLGNPGFEKRLPGHDWMPADWDTSDAGLPTVFFGRDTFLVHSGNWCVNIANTSTLYSMSHNWSQTVLVTRDMWGKDAVFSVWTRSNGLSGRAFVWLQAYRDTVSLMSRIWGISRDDALQRMGLNALSDPVIDYGWKSAYFEDPNTAWVKREVRVHIQPLTNVIFVRCGLLGTGQVLFDDASLTLVPAAPAPHLADGTNLTLDPSFENGGLAWEWAIPPFEGARIDRDSTVAHSGRISLRASNMRDGLSSTRMGCAQPIPTAGLGGKRIRISGWLKGDSLISTAYVKLYVHSPRGMTQSPATQLFSNTFDWSHAETEIDVPVDATEIWAWLAFDAPCAGTVWFDDGEVTVVGAAPKPVPMPVEKVKPPVGNPHDRPRVARPKK